METKEAGIARRTRETREARELREFLAEYGFDDPTPRKEHGMKWHIVQSGADEWSVRKGEQAHFAQTAEDAVKLMAALEGAGF